MESNLLLLTILPPDFWGLNTQLSLYSLLAMCLLSLTAVRKMTLEWSWPFLVKVGVVAIVAALGLIVGPIWVYSLIAWSMFVLLLFVVPLAILTRQNKYVMELNGRKVVETVGYLRWFYWGKSGQFWSDWANSFALYVEGKKDAADAILAKWKSEKVPEQLQALANDYRFYGYTLSKDWRRIIDAYESAKESSTRISNGLSLAATRAYAELKQFDSAAACLGQTKLPETKAGVHEHASTYLVYFCLTGQLERAKQLLIILNQIRHPLPSYVKSYWLGRMAIACGDKARARSEFQNARRQSMGSVLYQSRIDELLKQIESNSDSTEDDATIATSSITDAHKIAVDHVWETFRKAANGLRIVDPVHNSHTVTGLIALILAAFIASYSYLIVRTPATDALSSICFMQGLLIPELVRAGQNWRLVTYLFLHLHFFHLLFNLLGLWWFGRIAQSIYGTAGFLIVYFVAGIASGAAYVLLGSAAPALGASGAIMGVVGAVALGIVRLRGILPRSIRKKQLILLLGLLALQAVMDQIIPNIGVSIHMFGLAAGALLGFILPLEKNSNFADSD